MVVFKSLFFANFDSKRRCHEDFPIALGYDVTLFSSTDRCVVTQLKVS